MSRPAQGAAEVGGVSSRSLCATSQLDSGMRGDVSETHSDETQFVALRLAYRLGIDSIERIARPVWLVLGEPAAPGKHPPWSCRLGLGYCHRSWQRRHDSPNDRWRRYLDVPDERDDEFPRWRVLC